MHTGPEKKNYLGKKGQVRMEVNVVTAPVRNAPVIYAATNPALTRAAIFYKDCEDTLNALGNCYEWLEQGVIEPSVSPWASPLVPVKKNNGQTRWVTDLRELNKQTVKDSYLLRNIQEILHSLQGATVFSSLDACGAYHAVRIKPCSRACTAFISQFCTFQ